jgi:hypothetical protein
MSCKSGLKEEQAKPSNRPIRLVRYQLVNQHTVKVNSDEEAMTT